MKKWISVALTLALCLCILPASSMQATQEEIMPVQALYVGSVDALQTPQGDGWSYDAENCVLTLNNCTLTESVLHTVEYIYDDYTEYELMDTMIYFEGDLTIELVGNNSVERVVDQAPTDYTQYFAIFAGIYQTNVDGEVWDMPSKLFIRGAGNLTAGLAVSRDCLDAGGDTVWEYLNYSFGIFCNDEDGVDLTGLQRGGWVDVYGGVLDYPSYWKTQAWNTAPTFGDNAAITSYQDAEGLIPNSYNANNNNACRMKVEIADAALNENGLLSLMDSGDASGNGWTWSNKVLTLSADTAVKAVEFRKGLGNASLVLTGDVCLDSTDMGYDANWNSIPCIGAYCDLQIDTGAYTLTFAGDNNAIIATCADVLICGGTLENNSEYGGGVTVSAGDLTIRNATFRSTSGINMNEGYDADWNTIPAGDILIENASVTLANPIESYGNMVTVLHSDLTVSNGYASISASSGIFLQDSTVSLTSDSIGLSTDGAISIDNCNLNICAENEVIFCGFLYDDGSGAEADLSELCLTNMNITQPAGYQILAITDDWGYTHVTLTNADGTTATVLVATAAEEAEEECSHSYGEWVVVTPATLQTAGSQQKTCSLCGETVTQQLPCLAGDVESWNLTLGDDLGVNFKIALSEEIVDTAQIRITVCGQTEIFHVKDLCADPEDGSVIVSSYISAAQMGQSITVQIANGADVSLTKSYSVLQYAQTVLSDSSMQSYHRLIKEMLNYGAMAQIYFNNDPDNLVNAGINDAGATEVPDTTQEIQIGKVSDKLNFYGASLVHKDRIAVRYYFTGDVTGCSFTANGTSYTPVAKDGLSYIEIADILPQDLDQQITLTVTDSNGNTLSVSYGPMNYIVRMSQKGSDTLASLLKALYNYHLAAKAL